jgi:hypothetical protein
VDFQLLYWACNARSPGIGVKLLNTLCRHGGKHPKALLIECTILESLVPKPSATPYAREIEHLLNCVHTSSIIRTVAPPSENFQSFVRHLLARTASDRLCKTGILTLHFHLPALLMCTDPRILTTLARDIVGPSRVGTLLARYERFRSLMSVVLNQTDR